MRITRPERRRSSRSVSRTATLALVAALSTTAAACSGSESEAGAPDAPAATTTTVPPTYPLTGLPAAGGTALRPALSVKIDNVVAARPQAGVDKADVVYEEVVEGGLTRLLAVYQSTDAESIGPVRSVRPTDPDLASPFGGVFSYSGGSDRFDALIRATPGLTVVSADEDGAAYESRGPHRGDHMTYTSTAALWARAPAGAKPPPAFSPFLPAGQAFAPPGATPTTRVALVVGTQPVSFTFDPASKTWKRANGSRPDVLQDGTQVAPTNVIVQYVAYDPVEGAFDSAGAQVDVARMVGTGEALILSDGMLVRGRWSKPAPSAMTTYTDAAGAPVALPPGRTWVELPEPGPQATIS